MEHQVLTFFRRLKLLNNFDFGKLFAANSRKTTYKIETEFLSQWGGKWKWKNNK